MASGEFDLIARYFAPLAAKTAGTFGLGNDAALFDPPAGHSLVTTVDCMVAGVHFRAADAPADVAAKLLRVNLSDLAAMGARPAAYLLAASFPKDIEEAWIAAFASALADEQERFEIGLLGGDTTATPGPLTLSLTALGLVPAGRCLRRNTASAGDDVYVSGWPGEAALGLALFEGHLRGLSEAAKTRLTQRYLRPEPRLVLGRALLEQELASAALDVSDGLIADLGHICTGSGLGAELSWPLFPLSPPVAAALELDAAYRQAVLGGGDDYEMLFTAAAARASAVEALAERLDLPLTRIGRMTAAAGVVVRDAGGAVIDVPHGGWTHF